MRSGNEKKGNGGSESQVSDTRRCPIPQLQKMKTHDFLVIGAGIFGLAAAIELRQRKHSVGVLNPGRIPHPLAASTDISKIIRMEYGTDVAYMEMAIESMEKWREWNGLFGEQLYHECGFLLAASRPMEDELQVFEHASYQNLLRKNFHPVRLDASQISTRFPAFHPGYFTDGFFHAVGGFAESGKVVEALAKHARQLGIDIHEGQTAAEILISNGRAEAVRTVEGGHFAAGQIIVCAGNFTHLLVPDLQPYFRVTGHPVFHLKPSRPELFAPQNFPVFAADISNTGWYGFPLLSGVVKVANHGIGQTLHPALDKREVTDSQAVALRKFLRQAIPALADAPIDFTRLCCYTDTLDGHFWIDNHPLVSGLTIGSGGSGHGFKMGPVVGEMIASVAEGASHKWSDRYRWRELGEGTVGQEEARNISLSP